MNLYNDQTMDPTRWSNYLIHARAVDPKLGKTPEEVKKYTRLKIAAIAIKTFLALSVVGIMLYQIVLIGRAISDDNKAIIQADSELEPAIRKQIERNLLFFYRDALSESRVILERSCKSGQEPSAELMEGCVRRAYMICSRGHRGGAAEISPGEQLVVNVLKKTWNSHINRGGVFGMY